MIKQLTGSSSDDGNFDNEVDINIKLATGMHVCYIQTLLYTLQDFNYEKLINMLKHLIAWQWRVINKLMSLKYL